MSTLDALAALAFCLCGLFYICHTGRAIQTGVFIGWYKGSYEKYYIYRAKEPWNFYFNVIGMAVIGALLFAIGVVIFDESLQVFLYMRSLSV
ncbi:TPA: hypothetical protein I9Y23_003274 [Kluyvera ascorbata]|uniref:Uncharacterized protein n=1 Tax=Kluyvera genomosp. 2 TaxID=2774054 RepID=A0A2T2XVP3_9ENTR|nr:MULTISPECIES: hypothetical protein [Enterobacteriaceae]HAT3919613.1 hypothetical protein [Kluyvera ascorbata]PSR44380.1 hypothetical protein C8256_23630 [Kluyvera genomosp. 2]BBQ84089.1 hypothetical protein WP3W18E02_26180 [Klebsiella sp. WP3-W18-ESBL-02]BBR21042.1 hypothetical protein WP3S18E05_25220 [Klebsiella sp. WP3-S18-ESBL-05]HAT3945864.1 hypothetical protein [Kluyvera ascorbata]